jgi:hypothetical protein
VADQRITQLTALPREAVAANDVLPISDISASETKKITARDLVAAGIDLVDIGAIDLAKLNQSSATKLDTVALADDAITAAKLAGNSVTAVEQLPPGSDNFEGRVWYHPLTGNLQVYAGSAYQQVVMPAAGIGDAQVTTAKLANGAVTTAKVSPLATAAYADASVTTAKLADGSVTAAKIAADSITSSQIAPSAVGISEIANSAVTYAKIQNVSATDRLLGRTSAGAGVVEEISCTAAGRALLDDATAADQRATLGLGSLATGNGTWVNGSSFSGTSSGTNTGDQTITLTGDVTGSGTGSFAATVSNLAITNDKLADSSVSTAKLQDTSVTAAKLTSNSSTIVSTVAPSGSGAFVGQGWLNSTTSIAYTWTGTAWVREAGIGTITVSDSTPIAISVSYPDAYTATLTTTLDPQVANTVWAGPASGGNAEPTFRALTPSDLPNATASTRGIMQPGTGLSVASGVLNHSNAVTASTVSGITFDAQGHITAAAALAATDIPVLDASKITTGEFATARLANDSVTAAKLANYATAQIGETLPVADYIGQIFFNPLDKAFFLWDGNVWQPIGISQGSVVFAGTYNANTNQVASVTTEGSAIGLTVGQPLPTATQTNLGYYVVVSTGGTGTAPAPTVTLAPPDLILSNGTQWYEVDVSATYVAQTAANIGFTPAASLGSATVQAAIEEVSNECRDLGNMTAGTLAVARGGTSFGSYTKGDLLAATGTTALAKLGVGTNGQTLRANSATATGLEWVTPTTGTVTSVTGTAPINVATGTTTPVISVTAASTSASGVVQLTDSTSTTSSTLAATATAVKSAFDLANAALSRAGGVMTGNIELGINLGIIFEGTVNDAFETTLIAVNPTADRTLSLPDKTGVVAVITDLDDGSY